VTAARTGARWWLRSLAIGAGVGFGVGLVVGGTLGRVFMRLLFLAREDTAQLETAMGAIIGDLTASGTLAIAVFGAGAGMMLGLGYVAVRRLLPSRLWWREALFVLGATGFLLGFVVRTNLEDFGLLPVTLSLALTAGAIALTAIPVPLLVERFALRTARGASGRRGTRWSAWSWRWWSCTRPRRSSPPTTSRPRPGSDAYEPGEETMTLRS
jgi:hypothetical protein